MRIVAQIRQTYGTASSRSAIFDFNRDSHLVVLGLRLLVVVVGTGFIGNLSLNERGVFDFISLNVQEFSSRDASSAELGVVYLIFVTISQRRRGNSNRCCHALHLQKVGKKGWIHLCVKKLLS